MIALFLVESIRAEFDKEHYLRYEEVNERYLAFIKARNETRSELVKEAQQSSTLDEQAECASHLMAVIEKHSEHMAKFAREFNEVILSWMARKRA